MNGGRIVSYCMLSSKEELGKNKQIYTNIRLSCVHIKLPNLTLILARIFVRLMKLLDYQDNFIQ